MTESQPQDEVVSVDNRRGLFITLEGLDGCGKSTQMKMLAARLEAFGRSALMTAEPGGTPIGIQIRRILLDADNADISPTAELLLYFAARAQNVDQWILPALQEGKIVISDRFTDSTLAYQGLGRGLGEETVLLLDSVACRGLKPDLTLLLDIDLETSLVRARLRNSEAAKQGSAAETRMEDEGDAFHRLVRDAYLRIAENEPERVRVIDARGGIETVASAIWAAVEPLLARYDV